MNFYSKHTALNEASIRQQSLGKNYRKEMAVFTTRHEKAKQNREQLRMPSCFIA